MTETTPEPTAAEHTIPGPRATVLRALPGALGVLVGMPVLAWFVPDGGGNWWATGILILAILVSYGLGFLQQRRLPRMPHDVDPTRWQRAITSARSPRTAVPSEPAIALAAARAAHDRVVMALFATSVLAGVAGGMLVRPDLEWLPPIGGLLVISVLYWVQLPAAWAYLRAYAAARPA